MSAPPDDAAGEDGLAGFAATSVVSVVAIELDTEPAGAVISSRTTGSIATANTEVAPPAVGRRLTLRGMTPLARPTPPRPPPAPSAVLDAVAPEPTARPRRVAARRPAISPTSLLVAGRPETPSVVDRALAIVGDSDRAHVERLKRELARTEPVDQARAAILAYELGVVSERRFADDDAAIESYRRALSLDAALTPSSWALRRILYRRDAWPEVLEVLAAEIHLAPDTAMVDLLVERVDVYARAGDDADGARVSLDAALRLAPSRVDVLLAAYGLHARERNHPELLELTSRLARATDHPLLAMHDWLAVGMLSLDDSERALSACETAYQLATQLADDDQLAYVARTWLRLAYAHGASTQAPLDALAKSLATHDDNPQRCGQLVAILRRQARSIRRDRPADAWALLQQAWKLSSSHPVLLADRIELAAEIGRYQDLLSLTAAWRAAESEQARVRMVAAWCASARATAEPSLHARALLGALSASTPGLLLLSASAESDNLREGAVDLEALAVTYIEAARAALSGTWVGAGEPVRAEPRAAAGLYIQAAELLAFHVATPAAIAHARDLLGKAAEAMPEEPAVVEAQLDLDDASGEPTRAIASLLKMADRETRQDALERATRIAAAHGLHEGVVDLQRQLLRSGTFDATHAWRLQASLARLGRSEERLALLHELTQADADPARRQYARLEAARLSVRTGDLDDASRLFHEIAIADPANRFARDSYLELLRQQERWADLVDARRDDVRGESDAALVRRAFREATWVLEVRLDNAEGAASMYDEWLARMPEDRTALEGLARCAARLRDPQREAAARRAIADVEQTAEARWLHARSMERLGSFFEATARYREVHEHGESSVAVINAAIALGDLAAASSDVTAHVEAADRLAAHVTHPDLRASLHGHIGWLALLALDDSARAREAFEAARPHNAALGSMMATLRDDGVATRHADATCRLAESISDATAAALLHLRAAAIARATGDHDRATACIANAADHTPDSAYVLNAAADLEHGAPVDIADPFAAADRFATAAGVYHRRSLLTDDPATRRWWNLARAEALIYAGEPREAANVIASVLAVDPHDRRALVLFRHLASHVGDRVREAEAAYALSRLTTHRESRLRLLRVAAAVYDGAPPHHHVGFAITIYKQIAVLDELAPETDRLLELVREGGNADALVEELTEQLARLAERGVDPARMVPLLLERATVHLRLQRIAYARADVEAVLTFAPDHLDAVRLRSEIIGRWEENTAEAELTDAESLRVLPGPHEGDLFGGTTARVDVSDLLAMEQQLARNTTVTAPVPVAELADIEASQTLTQTAVVRDTQETPAAAGVGLAVPPISSARVALAFEPTLAAQRLEIVEAEATERDTSLVTLFAVDDPQSSRDAWLEAREIYNHEIATAQDPASLPALHVDAAHAAEVTGDHEASLRHYNAALLAVPDLGPAIEGVRRLALRRADVLQAIRMIDRQLVVASGRDREALERYRADLAFAARDWKTAQYAFTSLTARASTDIAAMLGEVAVAVAERRVQEVAGALERIAMVDGHALRSAFACARAAIAVGQVDSAGSALWYTAAAADDSPASAAALEAVRYVALRGEGDRAGAALLDYARHIEGEDPTTAAAFAIRAQSWLASRDVSPGRETSSAAAQLAAAAAPRDPLVGRILAETALEHEPPNIASNAFVRWTRCRSSRVERAYAAARAAELEPARLGRLWAQVLDTDPGDDYASARLRAVHLAGGALDQAIELDLTVARDTQRDFALVRAAIELVANDQAQRAIDVLAPHARGSLELRHAYIEALSAARRWEDAATELAELGDHVPASARPLVDWRTAHAWSEAARAAGDGADRTRILGSALVAWNRVLDSDPGAPVAHASALEIAQHLDDVSLIGKALARLRACQRSPWAAASVGLRQARRMLDLEPRVAGNLARVAAGDLDDPRAHVLAMVAAARRHDLAAAAQLLEERATKLTGAPGERAMLHIRAAHLRLDANDAHRALALLAPLETQLPVWITSLVDCARARAGQPLPHRALHADAPVAWLLRTGEDAEARGDLPRALELYTHALAEHDDPISAFAVETASWQMRETDRLRALAGNLVARATRTDDAVARADAYELLATIELVLARDPSAARTVLAAALAADPTRAPLHMVLDRVLAATRDHAARAETRDMVLAQLRRFERPIDLGVLADSMLIASRAGRRGDTVIDLAREIVAREPRHTLALFHLEAELLMMAPSAELASTQQQIAELFDQPTSRAALLTRAGETLADCGERSRALEHLERAITTAPGYAPAVESWRHVALAGELWKELAKAAMAHAQLEEDPERAAGHAHFAGVVLMDRANKPEQARAAFCLALDHDPSHDDSLLRLRQLAVGPDGADVFRLAVRRRLELETAPASRAELHRMLAEHLHETGDREAAIVEYRTMLTLDPTDVRAHAAIADCSTDPASWKNVADAIRARIPLERDLLVQGSLYARLGATLAPHDRDEAREMYRKALTFRHDHAQALRELLALDLADSRWADAATTCARLVTLEREPAERAHLLRTAAFIALRRGDKRGASTFLDESLDAAPIDADAVQHAVGLFERSEDQAVFERFLERVTAALRDKLCANPLDTHLARVLSRGMMARAANAGGATAQTFRRIGRIAGELASLGTAGTSPPAPAASSIAALTGPKADGALFDDVSQVQVRRILAALAHPIARLTGTDLGKHGVGRKHRLAANHPAVAQAQAVAAPLGFADVEVYVSPRHDLAIVAEPTTPVSLVIGASIATNEHYVRFAAGAALKLVQMQLAIPARMSVDELRVLGDVVWAMLRPAMAMPDPTTVQLATKLRKYIPAPQLEQLASAAQSVPALDMAAFGRALKLAGLRAGLVACGSLRMSLEIVRGASGIELEQLVHDKTIQTLIDFGLREHAGLSGF